MSWLNRFRRQPSPENEQARRRLGEIEDDDEKVDQIANRVRQILRENNLAADIARALGERRT